MLLIAPITNTRLNIGNPLSRQRVRQKIRRDGIAEIT